MIHSNYPPQTAQEHIVGGTIKDWLDNNLVKDKLMGGLTNNNYKIKLPNMVNG